MASDSNGGINNSGIESVIVIRSDEEDSVHSNVKANLLRLIKVVKDEVKVKDSCVVDVNGGVGENSNEERVCRICHLNSDQSSEINITSTGNKVDLIQIGCGCKGELGIVHSHCAEAWFKVRGNRLCEICGETATNVTGVGDSRFLEEWNEGRSSGSLHPSENGGCWRGQPFCNFLMACLVIAFVLPWFFRVNMF